MEFVSHVFSVPAPIRNAAAKMSLNKPTITYLHNPLPLYLYSVEVVFFFILIILQTVGLLGRVISSSQALYLNTGQHKHRINTYTYQTFMSCMGFENTIPASEQAKTIHALDRSATVTGEPKIMNQN
jgi:hypothetical protein